MASISRDSKGNITIQFVAGDGKRRSIRLGKINAKTANEVKLKVEHLNALLIANLPMDADTARWVAGLGDDLAAKLAAVGLIPARQSATLWQFLTEYLDGRKAGGSKPATVVTIHRVIHDLTQFFGPKIGLRDIGEGDAERFKVHYQKRGLAGATIHRRLKNVQLLFKHAVKVKLIPVSPFAEVRSKNANPVERRHYVSQADTEKLLAASRPLWRTIIALARYGGLRCRRC